MIHVKRGNVARKRRKKILNHTTGFKVSNSRLFKVAHQQYMKSLRNSYVGRKQRKRSFRQLWIMRINCALRNHGLFYSKFIHELKEKNIGLNRKILCQLAYLDSPILLNLRT
jgi:large subunit ribosomal protein L20